MADMQSAPYTTGNQPSQAFRYSTSHLYPNESAEDASTAENAVGINPTPGSDNFNGTQPPWTGDTADRSYYCAGVDWSDFNACDPSTSQGQWNNFAMHNTVNAASGDGMEKWSYLSNDWIFFNATFDGFNNCSASNI
jgi:hypothetical protein